jgi:hypothetical protein
MRTFFSSEVHPERRIASNRIDKNLFVFSIPSPSYQTLGYLSILASSRLTLRRPVW